MNIYAGNLHYDMDEDQLRRLFEEYGEVESVKVIIDRDTGRSKGFGFVEMADDDAGHKALEELNGQEIQGRNLKVNIARERVRRDNFRRDY